MASVESNKAALLTAEAVKVPETVNVAVDEVHASDSESSSSKSEKTQVVSSRTESSSLQLTRVIETTRSVVQRVVSDIDEVDDHYFQSINIETYLSYIADERIFHLPHRGSSWDKVLKAAEFFGLQIVEFSDAVSHFVPESRTAAFAALASCRLLLELGHNNASALEASFNILYQLGQLISRTIRTQSLADANRDIKEDLGDVFEGLVNLVADIAIYYRQRINSMTSGTVKIDFFGAFGSAIDRLFAKKEHLSNHMWALKLRGKKHSLTIESLRHKLTPADRSARGLLLERYTTKNQRADSTCEWLQGYLLDFLRNSDDVFTITGSAGCGKSTLASWISDRLDRPLGRRTYETISYAFPFDAAAEATPLAFIKNVIVQLLERSVGDIPLYEKLVKTFDAFSTHRDTVKLENALWEALETGLKTIESARVNLVIIVDGLDQISGGDKAAVALHQRLHKTVAKFQRTRAVVLSRPISHLTTPGVKHFVITKDHTHDDIEAYIKETLTGHAHFEDQGHEAQAKLVDNLVHKSKGSFLWTSLVLRSLNREQTHKGFLDVVNNTPSDLTELLNRLIGKFDFKHTTTRTLFALMLAGERPFHTTELTELLQINTHKHCFTSERFDLKKTIEAPCDYFVTEHQGLVRFRHSSIRSFLLDLAVKEKVLMSMKDAHYELTSRMLLYAKLCLTQRYEPTIEGLTVVVVKETFHSHKLLQYVVLNWLSHFKLSSMCGSKGELTLSSHFKSIFPDSAFFGLLERHCWGRETSITEVIHHHDFAMKIRIGCFGEKHISVLQSVIYIGVFYRAVSNLVEAANCFYRASTIGQSVLYKFSTTVIACTNYFLSCTETITFTKRTEIVTYREEMIRFMIEICKCKHGKTSDHVIRWYKVLAQLYVTIKEEHHATIIYRELHEIITIRFGKDSDECRHITEKLGGMMVVLKKDSSEHDIIKYNEYIFETSEEMEVTSELRISVIIQLALAYEARGEWFLAEQLFINFWRRISEMCRVKQTTELHVINISIAIEYIKFLRRIERYEEATNILVCLWAEYEHHKCEDELIIIRIKEIGCMFKTFGILDVAISIFAKVWGYFKASGKTNHHEAASTTILITEVVEEITETTTKTTTKTITTTTETVVREVFETTYTRCKSSTVDVQFFKACITLINLYIAQQKWSEVEVIIKRSLEISWKAILTVETELTITGEFISEMICVAKQLGYCYHKQGYFEKAETIYLRIYRACLRSLHIEHVCVTEASLCLIDFYEEYHRHDKTIEVYIELLGHYRKHCGASHHLTIKTLYRLGHLCVLYGHKDAYSYYIEIVTVLAKTKEGHCHRDAFDAYVVLCRHYHETERWVELREICSVLWTTFVHHHHEFTFTAELIEVLYERYIYVLEFHAKVQFEVLYKLSVEYCETVTKYAGVTAAIVTIAMLALARICEKHEKHYHESITIYEEVIKRTTTTETKTITTTSTEVVKKRLSKMYIQIITTGGSTTTHTCERALTLCLEIYAQLKIEFGCWHEKTLLHLKEIIFLYRKIGNSHEKIVRLLEATVIEIITTVTKSVSLYHAAIAVAAMYVEFELVDVGQKLLHQLRHLILLHDIGSTEVITIKLGCKVTKVSYVFLAAFEQVIYQKLTLSYSEIMADILTETILYEQYTRTITSTTVSFTVLLQYGAALRTFWLLKSRHSAIATLDAKLFAMFLTQYGAHIKTTREVTFNFYTSLLATLGEFRTTKFDFIHLSLVSAVTHLTNLLNEGKFPAAHTYSQCAVSFLTSISAFSSAHGLAHGYKLAELLAGRDKTPRPSDATLRASLLATSRAILNQVFAAARAAGVSFVGLQFRDLDGLVGLLGAQKNYAELEFLLNQLWSSREVQKTWTPATVVALGTSLVHARAACGKSGAAIRLAEDLAYNLRRSRGPLEKTTREAERLLASLYTASGRFKDAMGVYEEVLREVDENAEESEEMKVMVKEEVELLRRSFMRNKGWDKSEAGYKSLLDRLSRFGIKEDAGKWKAGDAGDIGLYKGREEWGLGWGADTPAKRKEGGQRKRASDIWVCGGWGKPELAKPQAIH